MLKNLIDKLPSFIRESGKEKDVVVGSGIIILRNIRGIPFPNRASREEKEKVIKIIRDVISKSKFINSLNLFEISLLDISDIERRILVNMQIIPKKFSQNPYSKYLFISDDGRIIFMINGEDHIGIKVIESGLSLNKTLDMVMKIGDELENYLDISYMKDFGYLTASPENVGTGLKAFIIMYLPIMKLMGKIENIKKSAPKFSFSVEELFDSFFLISNKTTLGRSEENIIKTIESIGKEIGNMEREERRKVLKKSDVYILNKIERAKGIVRYSLSITYDESLDLLSWIRLGVIIEDRSNIKPERIDELFIRVNPEYEKIEFGDVSGKGIDSLRARLLKEYLKDIL